MSTEAGEVHLMVRDEKATVAIPVINGHIKALIGNRVKQSALGYQTIFD